MNNGSRSGPSLPHLGLRREPASLAPAPPPLRGASRRGRRPGSNCEALQATASRSRLAREPGGLGTVRICLNSVVNFWDRTPEIHGHIARPERRPAEAAPRPSYGWVPGGQSPARYPVDRSWQAAPGYPIRQKRIGWRRGARRRRGVPRAGNSPTDFRVTTLASHRPQRAGAETSWAASTPRMTR
jgi:hypothetical protein